MYQRSCIRARAHRQMCWSSLRARRCCAPVNREENLTNDNTYERTLSPLTWRKKPFRRKQIGRAFPFMSCKLSVINPGPGGFRRWAAYLGGELWFARIKFPIIHPSHGTRARSTLWCSSIIGKRYICTQLSHALLLNDENPKYSRPSVMRETFHDAWATLIIEMI